MCCLCDADVITAAGRMLSCCFIATEVLNSSAGRLILKLSLVSCGCDVFIAAIAAIVFAARVLFICGSFFFFYSLFVLPLSFYFSFSFKQKST